MMQLVIGSGLLVRWSGRDVGVWSGAGLDVNGGAREGLGVVSVAIIMCARPSRDAQVRI